MPPTMMDLLHDGVPVTLLLDLADSEHLPSRAIYRREPADLSWLAPHGTVAETAAHEQV